MIDPSQRALTLIEQAPDDVVEEVRARAGNALSWQEGSCVPGRLHRRLQRHGNLHQKPARRPALPLHGKGVGVQGQRATRQSSRQRF